MAAQLEARHIATVIRFGHMIKALPLQCALEWPPRSIEHVLVTMMGTFKYFNSKLSNKFGHTSLPAIVPTCETRSLSYDDDEVDGSLSALKPPPQFYDSTDYYDSDDESSQQQEDVVIA